MFILRKCMIRKNCRIILNRSVKNRFNHLCSHTSKFHIKYYIIFYENKASINVHDKDKTVVNILKIF